MYIYKCINISSGPAGYPRHRALGCRVGGLGGRFGSKLGGLGVILPPSWADCLRNGSLCCPWTRTGAWMQRTALTFADEAFHWYLTSVQQSTLRLDRQFQGASRIWGMYEQYLQSMLQCEGTLDCLVERPHITCCWHSRSTLYSSGSAHNLPQRCCSTSCKGKFLLPCRKPSAKKLLWTTSKQNC